MKKILIVICFILVMLCSSCDASQYKKEQFEDDFLKYEVIKKKTLGSKYECYITGLTDLGKSQTHLILAEYYNDYQVLGIGYQDLSWLAPMQHIGSFETENLERMYLNLVPKGDPIKWVNVDDFSIPNAYIVIWKTGFQTLYINNHNGYIYGYNFYLKEIVAPSTDEYNSKIANVSYMYNYDNSPNEGYYWVDNYTNGLIEFIPPTPIREGYEFKGWYKEPECLNAWDFGEDILGDDILIGSQQILEYTGTYLYAKWSAL